MASGTMRRLVWFAGMWIAGVLAVMAIGLVIRLFLVT